MSILVDWTYRVPALFVLAVMVTAPLGRGPIHGQRHHAMSTPTSETHEHSH
jgi:hypothetical protein